MPPQKQVISFQRQCIEIVSKIFHQPLRFCSGAAEKCKLKVIFQNSSTKLFSQRSQLQGNFSRRDGGGAFHSGKQRVLKMILRSPAMNPANATETPAVNFTKKNLFCQSGIWQSKISNLAVVKFGRIFSPNYFRSKFNGFGTQFWFYLLTICPPLISPNLDQRVVYVHWAKPGLFLFILSFSQHNDKYSIKF